MMANGSPVALDNDDMSWQPPSPQQSLSSSKKNSQTSTRLPPSFSLPILPFTSVEWTNAISDVKSQYAKRQFRSCVSRCNEILKNLRDQTTVQPAYLIYLHFYAASSQETMACGLHHASSQRKRLLSEAQDHYTKASQLIATADAFMSDRASKRGSTTSSVFTCGDSPIGIMHGQSTGMWSPSVQSQPSSRATSISSIEDAYPSAMKNKKRVSWKRVSFKSDVSDELRSIERPDSPTLGLSTLAGSSFKDLLDAMPTPPPRNSVPEPGFAQPNQCEAEETLHNIVSARRCSVLLGDLQSQISRHLSFIETDLAEAQSPPPTATNLGLDEEERRSLDLQARIERLRAGGWQRRRFDASRYAELRESAMADMFS